MWSASITRMSVTEHPSPQQPFLFQESRIFFFLFDIADNQSRQHFLQRDLNPSLLADIALKSVFWRFLAQPRHRFCSASTWLLPSFLPHSWQNDCSLSKVRLLHAKSARFLSNLQLKQTFLPSGMIKRRGEKVGSSWLLYIKTWFLYMSSCLLYRRLRRRSHCVERVQ